MKRMFGAAFAAAETVKGSDGSRGQQAAVGFATSAAFAARKVEEVLAIAVVLAALPLFSSCLLCREKSRGSLTAIAVSLDERL